MEDPKEDEDRSQYQAVKCSGGGRKLQCQRQHHHTNGQQKDVTQPKEEEEVVEGGILPRLEVKVQMYEEEGVDDGITDDDDDDLVDNNDDYVDHAGGGSSSCLPGFPTNFHLSLCVGVAGFLVFWVVLLLRIYLPPEVWSSGDEEEGKS